LPQKIDALHAFVLPKIDYLLQSGDVSVVQLEDFDAHVRGVVQGWTTGKGIHCPIFYMTWKDSGILLPSVEGRLKMILGTPVQLLQSKDKRLRDVFHAFLNEERGNLHFAKRWEGMTATGFLNWDSTQMAGLNPTGETMSLFWKSYEPVKPLNLRIIPQGAEWIDFTSEHSLASQEETVTSKYVSKFIA
jgi:hypothetical protein